MHFHSSIPSYFRNPQAWSTKLTTSVSCSGVNSHPEKMTFAPASLILLPNSLPSSKGESRETHPGTPFGLHQKRDSRPAAAPHWGSEYFSRPPLSRKGLRLPPWVSTSPKDVSPARDTILMLEK